MTTRRIAAERDAEIARIADYTTTSLAPADPLARFAAATAAAAINCFPSERASRDQEANLFNQLFFFFFLIVYSDSYPAETHDFRS